MPPDNPDNTPENRPPEGAPYDVRRASQPERRTPRPGDTARDVHRLPGDLRHYSNSSELVEVSRYFCGLFWRLVKLAVRAPMAIARMLGWRKPPSDGDSGEGGIQYRRFKG